MEYKLTYFDIKARGETARMLFKLGKQEFTDNRIQPTPEDWFPLIPTLPFGALPILEFGGQRFCQAGAIERFLAKKFGVYGDTEVEHLQCDMVVGCLADAREAMGKIRWAPDPETKAKLHKEYVEEKGPKYWENLEKMANSSGHFVGNKLSWADILCYNSMDLQRDSELPCKEENFPKIMKVIANVAQNAEIAKWIAERPKTVY